MSGRPPRAARVTWAAGGWVLLLGAILAAGVAWRLLAPALEHGVAPRLDPTDARSYGIPLEPASIPASEIVGSGLPREGLPALELPGVVSPQAVDSLQHAGRAKYLVPDDRVIGVTIRGASRCYPILALNWHEVVNDTLGSVPIAVCYHPLSDAAAVFERDGGLHLAVSGLLWNSTHLLRDRATPPNLYSPILGRAVVGPEARSNAALTRVPCTVTTWADWRKSRPETTVLRRDPRLQAKYASQPYGSYFGDDRLRYPVHPLPPPGTAEMKSPVLVLMRGERRLVLSVRALVHGIGGTTERTIPFDGELVTVHFRSSPECAWVDPAPGLVTVQSFWFAWHASFPADALARP